MIVIDIDKNILELPESIHDISIKRFLELRKIDVQNPLQLFEWGIGKSIKLLNNKSTQTQVENTLKLIDPIVKEIFDYISSGDNLLPPNNVIILGLEIKITKDLIKSLPYWAFVKCKEIILEQKEDGKEFDATDRIPEIIGHYLYEVVTKSTYNEKKAQEFSNEVITDMPMIDAIKLGNFFLLQQVRLFRNNQTSFLIRLMLMRKKLASRLSQNMARLTRSKV